MLKKTLNNYSHLGIAGLPLGMANQIKRCTKRPSGRDRKEEHRKPIPFEGDVQPGVNESRPPLSRR